MSAAPLVSIITPTGRREALLQAQYAHLTRQTVQDFEWLILDDGPEPSGLFSGLNDQRIRYEHRGGPRLTIGAKRNLLVERARSDLVVHLDDDDFYAPRYLETMAAGLGAGADVTAFSAFYVYSVPYRFLGYWDLSASQAGLHYQVSPLGVKAVTYAAAEPQGLGDVWFGFCLAFRKAVWAKTLFEDRNHGEDSAFVMEAQEGGFKLDMFADSGGLCLHILRRDNNSQCYPQYALPDFLLTRIFGPEPRSLLQP